MPSLIHSVEYVAAVANEMYRIEGIYKALETYEKGGADIIIAIGGGSVIDSSKVISQFYNEKHGSYIKAIAIPMTLSAAEYTSVAGFTKGQSLSSNLYKNAY